MLGISAEELLRTKTVPELREICLRLETEASSKQRELQTMVLGLHLPHAPRHYRLGGLQVPGLHPVDRRDRVHGQASRVDSQLCWGVVGERPVSHRGHPQALCRCLSGPSL